MLRWPPSEFWQSTVSEITYAFDGYCESKGIKTDRVKKSNLTEDQVAELRELLKKHG